MVAIFLGFVTVYGVVSETLDAIGLAWFVVLTGYFFVLFIRPRFHSVNRGLFYDDHAELTGRNDSAVFRYADMAQVLMVKKLSFFDPYTRMHIQLKGKDGPLIIFENPRNRTLKTDLYTWLLSKVSP